MRFTVETWDPAYGSPVRDHDLDRSTQSVDAAVEDGLADWRPHSPDGDGGHGFTAVTFVDGVRRIDARLWITERDGRTRPGVCASVAAGAVRCHPGRAEVTHVVVERGLYTAASDAVAIVPVSDSIGPYELRPVSDDSDESLYLGVHRHMTAVEVAVAQALTEETGSSSSPSAGPELIVFDGPLGHREGANVVGYIKTHHVDYLAPEQQLVVSDLDVGQRTPLFRVDGQWPTWSWYLRLPAPITHGMSGIVRLELPGLGDAETAAHRADVVSAALPRYASERHKDPRAPQNLYPISGLERQLRRRLGDSRLLERALRRSAA